MPKYLHLLPKPFLDDLAAGIVVPFVGAGFSRNASVGEGKMPTWDGLGKGIAAQLDKTFEYTNALDAISAYDREFGKAKLVEEFSRSLYIGRSLPGAAHRSFARVPFRLVVTTNFDNLLESAYADIPRYCRAIVGEEPLTQNITPGEKSVTLVKMHGDLTAPSHLIATEDDYDGFLAAYPLLATFVANLLIQRTALFLGYSLSDPHFRVVWGLIRSRLGALRRRAYTFEIGPSRQTVDRFSGRGVRVIPLPGDIENADTIYGELFEELSEFWSARSATVSAYTSDDSKAAVISSASSTASGNICFIDVPNELISWYRENVYPLVERYSLAPISIVDVLAPGENITAILNEFISKSVVVIVDIGSSRRNYKTLRYIRDYSRTASLVLVGDTFNLDKREVDHDYIQLQRPSLSSSSYEQDLQDFSEKLSSWLHIVVASMRPPWSEAERLIEQGENRAAFISAVSAFEAILRRLLSQSLGPQRIRPAAMHNLFNSAVESKLLSRDEAELMREYYRIRSLILHEGRVPDNYGFVTTTRQVIDVLKRISAEQSEQ